MRWLILCLLIGCGDDGNVNPLPDAPLPPDDLRPPGVYVLQGGTNSISIYAPDATGDAAPVRTIAGASTGLSLALGIAVSPAGELYVANRTASTITVYDRDANGDVPPTRTLTATGMGSPQVISFGKTGDMLVECCPTCGSGNGGDSAVFHFAPNATTSDGELGGTSNTNTGFTTPGALVRDPDTDEIYVGNAFGGNISHFAGNATGDVAPISAFSPGNGNLQSIAFTNHSLLVAMPSVGIMQFPADATGTPQPTSTIPFTGDLAVQFPGALAIDDSVDPPVIYFGDFFGNALKVIQTAGSAPNLTVASVTTISGPNTGLNQPLGILVIK